VATGESRGGGWRDLAGVIVAPGQTFARLRSSPALLAPYAALAAGGLIANLLVLGRSVSLLERALALATLMTGGEARFRQLLSLSGYASLPVVLGWVVTAVVRAAVPAERMHLVTTSAAALLPGSRFGTWEHRVLSLVDPFSFWSLALLVVGYAAVNGVGRLRAAAAVVPLWLIVNLLYLIAALSGRPGA